MCLIVHDGENVLLPPNPHALQCSSCYLVTPCQTGHRTTVMWKPSLNLWMHVMVVVRERTSSPMQSALCAREAFPHPLHFVCKRPTSPALHSCTKNGIILLVCSDPSHHQDDVSHQVLCATPEAIHLHLHTQSCTTHCYRSIAHLMCGTYNMHCTGIHRN